MTLDSYQRNRIRTLRPIMQLLSATPRSGAAKRQAAEATGFSAGRIEALHREEACVAAVQDFHERSRIRARKEELLADPKVQEALKLFAKDEPREAEK